MKKHTTIVSPATHMYDTHEQANNRAVEDLIYGRCDYTSILYAKAANEGSWVGGYVVAMYDGEDKFLRFDGDLEPDDVQVEAYDTIDA